MEKKNFYNVVNKLILPLFTGSFIVGEEESSSRDFEVAAIKQNTLLIKPSKTDEYRLIMKRVRPFESFEINLLKTILKELNEIAEIENLDANYVRILQHKAVEKAICVSIAPNTAETMLGIISELDAWSNRTYEGKKPSFGIIINQAELAEEEKAIHYTEISDKDFFALLTDGKDSFLEFDRQGYLMGYTSLAKARNYTTISPNEFDYVARYCNDRRVGIVLTDRKSVV